MKREIYDEDHEAFRASVKQFLDREVTPHLEAYAAGHGLDRDFWLAAGKQGFLGLEIPDEYGGSEAGDYRFNAVLTEELAKVNMTLPSCVGIHADTARQGHVDLRQLLGQHRVEAVVTGLGAAVHLGDLEAEEALLAGGQPEVAVEAVPLGVRLEVGRHLAVQELLHGGPEGLVVLVVDLTLHAPILPASKRAAGLLPHHPSGPHEVD